MQNSAGYLRIAARRKFVIGIPSLGGILLAWAIASSLPPQYTAQSVLALDARKVQVLTTDTVVSRLPSENAALHTELDALNSRSMAVRVAEQLDLENDPEVLREIGMPRSAWRSATQLFRSGIALFARQADARGPEETPVSRSEIVAWLLNGLRASNDRRSFTILVIFVSHNAEISAKIANAFASAYLDSQVDLKTKATRDANAWLPASRPLNRIVIATGTKSSGPSSARAFPVPPQQRLAPGIELVAANFVPPREHTDHHIRS